MIEFLTPKKVTLIVKPTSDCNLNCPYCYDRKNRSELHGKRMSFDDVKKILNVFDGNIQDWIWHGGEPLLMGVEWLDKANSIIREYSPDTKICVQTNGTLINDEFISLFKKYNMQPGLSFDGIKNEFTRKDTGRLLNVFSLLERNYINFGAIMVLTPLSIKNIIDEYEYSKRLNLRMQMNIVFKSASSKESLNMDGDMMADEIIKFFDYWIHDTNNPYSSDLCTDYLDRILGGRKFCTNIDCVGHWFSINSEGELYPCGRDWSESAHFGNIYDYDNHSEILQTDNFKNYIKYSRANREACSDCEFFFACQAGCYGVNHTYFDETGKMDPEPNHCKASKKVLTHVYNVIKNIDISNIQDNYNPLFLSYIVNQGLRSLKTIKSINCEVNLNGNDNDSR